MERLSGLDASFLYIDTPTQPLNVCSILILDASTMPGGYTFDRLRDHWPCVSRPFRSSEKGLPTAP
jgi:hypothetical protein